MRFDLEGRKDIATVALRAASVVLLAISIAVVLKAVTPPRDDWKSYVVFVVLLLGFPSMVWLCGLSFRFESGLRSRSRLLWTTITAYTLFEVFMFQMVFDRWSDGSLVYTTRGMIEEAAARGFVIALMLLYPILTRRIFTVTPNSFGISTVRRIVRNFLPLSGKGAARSGAVLVLISLFLVFSNKGCGPDYRGYEVFTHPSVWPTSTNDFGKFWNIIINYAGVASYAIALLLAVTILACFHRAEPEAIRRLRIAGWALLAYVVSDFLIRLNVFIFSDWMHSWEMNILFALQPFLVVIPLVLQKDPVGEQLRRSWPPVSVLLYAPLFCTSVLLFESSTTLGYTAFLLGVQLMAADVSAMAAGISGTESAARRDKQRAVAGST